MTRRTFVSRSVGVGAALLSPLFVRAQDSKPAMPCGVATGDVSGSRAVVWSRTDRPARMVVEYATTESFATPGASLALSHLEATDFTARLTLADLARDQRIFYRVRFQDLADLRVFCDPVAGSFASAPSDPRRNVTIAWSADTVGQGWGINPSWGGLRLCETMRRAQPDLFIHCGDTIYADGPLAPEVTLDDGTTWRNLVTPAKSKPAETLADYRGNYQYNLLDDNMRRFNAEVAQLVIWDDHEVRDNWHESRDLTIALLAARARQAFRYQPIGIDPDHRDRIHRTASLGPHVEVFALDMRSFRGANGENRQTTLDQSSSILGPTQLGWLKARLAASPATWKVIASDMPIGITVRDAPSHYEAIANGEPNAPLGRELEIADLLRFIKHSDVRNVVWITGDVHYCAAHHYDPARARFTDFDPFWEFVAGPLHAGTFGSNEMDPTFGPEVKFSGTPPGMKPNRPPSAGLQFFGTLTFDGRTKAMTAALQDLSGKTLYSVEIAAR